MIDDEIVGADRGEGVFIPTAMPRLSSGTGANAQMLDDDVVRGDINAAADKRDTGRGRGLARDSEKRFAQYERAAVEIDDAADFEHDDARTCGFDCGAE